MSYYYWFNRKELLEKTHDKYHNKGGTEKAALNYQKNKETIKNTEKDIHWKSLERHYILKAQYKE